MPPAMVQGGLAHPLHPSQADRLSADTVEQAVKRAAEQNPSVIDRVSEFYARAPGAGEDDRQRRTDNGADEDGEPHDGLTLVHALPRAPGVHSSLVLELSNP